MLGLITDRTQRNVHRRKELSDKGWVGMTAEERIEWMGNPLTATGSNLFACGPFYSSSVNLKYRNNEIVATSTVAGIYLYAISIIGKASDYQNKVLTLSADSIVTSSGGAPQLALYWHDDYGYEYAGGTLLSAGSISVNTSEWPNSNNRAYLAVYVYVTTFETVGAGATVRFGRVMLENGNVKHEYVPYAEILTTEATKGAYNYSDLNRVERAVSEIADRKGLNLSTKTDWTMWDIPTEMEMNRYLSNIATIRRSLTNTVNLPVAPTSMNNFTYEEANNIELILKAAYESLT